jgi:NitT/TauT family transport system substrate-binding protein
MKRSRFLSVMAVAALVAAACGDGGGGDGDKDQVTFLIDFFPSGNHSAFYAAVAEGYFDEQNLDVTIEHVIGGTEVIKSLVAGQAQFGYADFASMAVANQNEDAGLKAVMGILHQTPMSILSPAANGIAEPADLVGKRVVDFAGSSTQVVWPVFLEENGLSEEDINLELVDPATRLSLVTEGQADASVGFFTDNEPQLQIQCDCAVNVIKWKDWGIGTLSNGIVTSAQFLEENEDVARRFVAALVKGVEFAQQNPEAATDDLIELKADDIQIPKDSVVQQTLNELLLTSSPAGGGSPTGFMTEEDWQSTIDLMVKAEQMDAPDDITELYTNDLLPDSG